MWTFISMIAGVLFEDPIEVPIIEDKDVIQAFFSGRADPAFGVCKKIVSTVKKSHASI